jgi:DNA polymerase (family 10)
MINNEYIANIFEGYAQYLELKDEDPFKIRAYNKASFNIKNSTIDIAAYFNKEGKLPHIEGVGKNIALKIIEIIQKGTFDELENLKKESPPELFELFKIPSMGPKKIANLYVVLGIKNIRELEYACRENRLIQIKGFGEKMQEKILEGMVLIKQYSGRKLWAEVENLAYDAKVKLENIYNIGNVEIAGSFRRKLETVKDLDIVVSSDESDISDKIIQSNYFKDFKEKGDKKISLLVNNFPVDIRICKKEDFFTTLHHFTGSKFHNEKLRGIAKDKGYKLNEYGLFFGDEKVLIRSEEDIYKNLSLPYIIPEMREGLFEFERTIDENELIELSDIKGVFHIHTNYSDGVNSIEEIVKKSIELGLNFIGISDHSKGAYYAGGLTEEKLVLQKKEIKEVQNKYDNIKIFHGVESEIRSDGTLDYDDKTLDMLDFVIASVHSNFNMSEEEMTERIIRAIKNPHTTMLGHMTSRLLLARDSYKLDVEKILNVASDYKTIIELNANPQRLDIDWRNIPKAVDKNILISINPDAHNLNGLFDYRYGVFIARKGGLKKDKTLNTFNTDEVKKILKSLKTVKQSIL